MFVDASAIVAILAGEPEAPALAKRLDGAHARVTSPLAEYEAVLGIRRKRTGSVEEAGALVRDFLVTARIKSIPIAAEDARTALLAFSRYGKGQGHPAQLNLGDCFAYAMAKNHNMPLLFKGDDFSKTDIDQAAKNQR